MCTVSCQSTGESLKLCAPADVLLIICMRHFTYRASSPLGQAYVQEFLPRLHLPMPLLSFTTLMVATLMLCVEGLSSPWNPMLPQKLTVSTAAPGQYPGMTHAPENFCGDYHLIEPLHEGIDLYYQQIVAASSTSDMHFLYKSKSGHWAFTSSVDKVRNFGTHTNALIYSRRYRCINIH